jgi:hypothetical protein
MNEVRRIRTPINLQSRYQKDPKSISYSGYLSGNDSVSC